MSSCIIFGGSGFIGSHLAMSILKNKTFEKIYLLDIKEPEFNLSHKGVTYFYCDVREKIQSEDLLNISPNWIFNFAAIHREPGHQPKEYFETNILGAENICEYASKVKCNNIFFTSSISVYGPCLQPTTESALTTPQSPYGSSKLSAEFIHRIWLSENPNRRLIITRPGVIYGPGDPGNILRMIKAIKSGYFFFPGSKRIHKSYGYIFSFIDSIWYTMKQNKKLITYNYVEYPTLTIGELASNVKSFFGLYRPIISLPSYILLPIAYLLQSIFGKSNPIHPVRVKKAGLPTHIIPQYLIDEGFKFRFDFLLSLKDWISKKPEDFT